MTRPLPDLAILAVKIPVADLSVSRRWYADVFGLVEDLEWPDADGVVRGMAFAPLGTVSLALREHPVAAAATRDFGPMMMGLPADEDLGRCAEHLDRLGIEHTPVMSGARGRLVGFHDPDGHEVCFYAVTQTAGARQDATRTVRPVSSPVLVDAGHGR
ncbi:MAG: hypothetical protein JWP61_659 [Friedmanniella sp.]|nr:hypothetical protein [Friedmanniella sp.]